MDALADYGSDSDDPATSNGEEHATVKAAGAATSTATIKAAVLPPPQWNGPSSWIHGHANHFLTSKSPVSLTKGSTSSNKPQHAKIGNSTQPPPRPLAQVLRSQTHEFRNPEHLVQTVQTLDIANPFGSNVKGSVTLEAWEESDLLSLEEQARIQQAADTTTTTTTHASTFVQDQIIRAMGH